MSNGKAVTEVVKNPEVSSGVEVPKEEDSQDSAREVGEAINRLAEGIIGAQGRQAVI